MNLATFLDKLPFIIAAVLFAIGLCQLIWQSYKKLPENGLKLYSAHTFGKNGEQCPLRLYSVKKNCRRQASRELVKEWLGKFGDTFPNPRDMLEILDVPDLPTQFSIQSEIKESVVFVIDVGHPRATALSKHTDVRQQNGFTFDECDLIAGISVKDARVPHEIVKSSVLAAS